MQQNKNTSSIDDIHSIINDIYKDLRNEKILSCLILKDNRLIFEYYKNKKIQPNVQTINSCTKSIMSALIGIAIDQGLIEDIYTPIAKYFYDKILNDKKQEITISHLLTMTIGIDWPEFGEWNCFAPMVYSNDIINFILQRPMVVNPGEIMNYNSGCSHLLSAIIQKVSGISTHDFARKFLFEPIGITNSVWYKRQGVNLGADGLRITSEDMIKFGTLYLKKGKINGRQIIPEKWINESTKPRFITYKNIGYYGYHWWISSHKIGDREISFYFALGFGGQYIIIVPDNNMVVVFTSRLYDNSLLPMDYFKNTILNLML